MKRRQEAELGRTRSPLEGLGLAWRRPRWRRRRRRGGETEGGEGRPVPAVGSPPCVFASPRFQPAEDGLHRVWLWVASDRGDRPQGRSLRAWLELPGQGSRPWKAIARDRARFPAWLAWGSLPARPGAPLPVPEKEGLSGGLGRGPTLGFPGLERRRGAEQPGLQKSGAGGRKGAHLAWNPVPPLGGREAKPSVSCSFPSPWLLDPDPKTVTLGC